MKLHFFASALLLALPTAAHAIEAGSSSPQQQETEQWMALQLSGKAASPTVQQSTPAEQELILRRWLDSNQHAIPQFFDQKAGGTTGGGSN